MLAIWVHVAEIVTFGALLVFAAVNLAALLHFWYSPEAAQRRRFFIDAFVPAFGCIFCFVLLLGLQWWTKYAGRLAGHRAGLRRLPNANVHPPAAACVSPRRYRDANKKVSSPAIGERAFYSRNVMLLSALVGAAWLKSTPS